MAKNRKFLFLTIVIILSGILFTQYGCKHDPPLFSDICFESEILPIFQNNCAMSGCHGGTNGKHEIMLDTYEHIMAAGINSGNAHKSLVYKALTGGGESPMPPKTKLTGSQIALIYSWIQGGALNTTGCAIKDSIPVATCDTTNITYGVVIAPIISVCCLSCHGAGSDVDLSTYALLSAYLNINAQGLLNDINYVSGSQQMPPSYELDSCTRKKIRIWIQAGYPNN